MREANENGTLNAYIVRGDEVQTGDWFGYKIIAVVQSEYFWAAYMGLAHWSDSQTAHSGDKVSHEIAAKLFPTIDAVIPNYNN
jgi:hypothetical protein